MPKSPNQKLKILYLMDYLNRYSDEQHPVTMADIIAYLEKYDISADRKTIYSDIDALKTFGMDIVTLKGNRAGYYIGQRDFQLPELKLLVDSALSSRFLTEKKTASLIKKLERLMCVYESGKLKRQMYVSGRIKTMNETVFYTIDTVQNAIGRGKKLSFKYFDYNTEKKQVYRRGGERYTVNPAGLIYDNENYYLVSEDQRDGLIKNFRVDKMNDIKIEHKDSEFTAEKPDMTRYTERHFGMFTGGEKSVTLTVSNDIAGAVIDRFGKDVMMIPQGNGEFSVSVEVVVSPQFFGWICGFGELARITAPESVVLEMKEYLNKITANYI